ncbi:MAG: hypothetical protein R3C58_13525 [Parvularculaceae bacterium]
MKAVALLLLAAVQGADLTAPPEVKKLPDCVCPASSAADVTLSGFVVDAKIIPGSDLSSYEARMATIFDVSWSSDSSVKGRTAVWHNFGEAACAVSFDYGKKYSVKARRTDKGELETDACLMK